MTDPHSSSSGPNRPLAVWPVLTGHEDPTYVVETAITVIGPALGDFIDNSMRSLQNTKPSTYKGWLELRKKKAGQFGGELSPHDGRNLMWELKRYWGALAPLFPLASAQAKDLQGHLKTQLNDPQGRLWNTMNVSKHGDSIAPDAARFALISLYLTMRLLDAQEEKAYLRPLLLASDSTVKAQSHPGEPPMLSPAGPDVTCVGVHWVQPKLGIPGQWWWVEIADGAVTRVDVDLTTEDAARDLQAIEGPGIAGLAFCFSAPANYVLRTDVGSPEALWSRGEPFSHRSVNEAVAALGPPFRVVEHGQPMRRPDEFPNAFRETEISAWKGTSALPSSIFDVDGTDSVGALALNGMPLISEVRAGGAAVWPFQPLQDDGLTCVEVFPRSLWARLNPKEDSKSKTHPRRRAAFVKHVRESGTSVNQRLAQTFQEEERAFDAFLTAWSLSRYGGGIGAIKPVDLAFLEGQIWLPE